MEDFNRLRLKYHGDAVKLKEILQLECRQKCAKKLYCTLSNERFIFPSLALAEMSTSDDVADIHADIVGKNQKVLDMTAGLGIDSIHFAQNGCTVTAIELSPTAADALRHNVDAFNVNIQVIEADSVEWLESNDRYFDVIFIDPMRRDEQGRHFSFSKSVPDVTKILPLLQSRAARILIKASPMIDISAGLKELNAKCPKVTVIGTTRECKEVLIELDSSAEDVQSPRCITIGHKAYQDLPSSDECRYCIPQNDGYLLVPFPAVMKGYGGCISGYNKLHSSTHLYYSDDMQPSFPGSAHKIIDILPFNKISIKNFRDKYPKINVSLRNFPLSSTELVKKFKIKEGGDRILFAVTLHDNSRALIVTTL